MFKGVTGTNLFADVAYVGFFITRVIPSINIILNRISRLIYTIPFMKKIVYWFDDEIISYSNKFSNLNWQQISIKKLNVFYKK